MDDVAYKKTDPDLEGFETVNIVRGFTEIEPVYNVLREFNAFICGGYVRYMASSRIKPAPAGDVDIYSNDSNVYNELISKLRRVGRLRKKHENDVSVTFHQPKSGPFQYCPTIQLIKPIRDGAIVAVGSMREILSNFDFSVVRCGLVSPTEALVDRNFLNDERDAKLRLKNIHCPISSTLRCMKYARKGYYMRPMETLKLFVDWTNRDEEYRQKIIAFLEKSEGPDGLTNEEIEEFEAMMRID
jgi:hypothetical protein